MPVKEKIFLAKMSKNNIIRAILHHVNKISYNISPTVCFMQSNLLISRLTNSIVLIFLLVPSFEAREVHWYLQ